MESAPARAQSRIPPFRLSKTVQPAPHKGQRRWIPRFSGQNSSTDAKNGAKKACLSKTPSQPARDKGCGTQSPDTHNAACGIETTLTINTTKHGNVPTHTMLRAALKHRADKG